MQFLPVTWRGLPSGAKEKPWAGGRAVAFSPPRGCPGQCMCGDSPPTSPSPASAQTSGQRGGWGVGLAGRAGLWLTGSAQCSRCRQMWIGALPRLSLKPGLTQPPASGSELASMWRALPTRPLVCHASHAVWRICCHLFMDAVGHSSWVTGRKGRCGLGPCPVFTMQPPVSDPWPWWPVRHFSGWGHPALGPPCHPGLSVSVCWKLTPIPCVQVSPRK